ncbi:hypothetical protein FI667_g1644, partial [Globisporangium splendens]
MVRTLFLLIAGVVLAAVASGDQVADKPGEKETVSGPVLRGSTEVVDMNMGDNAPFALEAEDANSAPAEVRLTDEKEELRPPAGQEYYGGFYGYRRRFYYPYGGGYHYGWRYPLWYWNRYSPYYGGCGYGVSSAQVELHIRICFVPQQQQQATERPEGNSSYEGANGSCTHCCKRDGGCNDVSKRRCSHATTQGVAVDIGTHMHLSDATRFVNKNTGLHGNNATIARSNVLKRQDDTLTLEADDELMPSPEEEIIETVEKEALILDEAEDVDFARGGGSVYRSRFYYRYGSGYRCGWRYPMSY